MPDDMADEAMTWWYYDDISGKILYPKGVEKARKDEIKIVEGMKAREKVPPSSLPSGTKIIGTRWVDVNNRTRKIRFFDPRQRSENSSILFGI